MTTIPQHLENLIKKRISDNGYINMLKTLESAFLSPRHWILEFLQNAEDATRQQDGQDESKKFSIKLDQDSLWILNNGKAFSNDDFYAICDVNSQKHPSLGFCGYIGIGFKSIFRITNQIDIHSGDFHFRFDKNYWNDLKRNGIPLSKWPWEIFPIEINGADLPDGYTTGFYIPLKSTKGKEIVDDIRAFLTGNDFPKEMILLLKNINIITIQTPTLSFSITKEVRESEALTVGEKEIVTVRKQIDNQQKPEPEEDRYLIFRKKIAVPDYISKDEETERVRRSEIGEREIGLVFGLDSEGNLRVLSGKLAGIYSFLPVEGEQTGLPFGIFGDFIPQYGRDVINYSAKWNHWMCDEVVKFFKAIVQKIFVSNPQYQPFSVEILKVLPYSNQKTFWGTQLIEPIKHFLNSEPVYPDGEGTLRKLSDLVSVDNKILEVIGKDVVKETIGNIAHPSIKDKIGSMINGNITEASMWQQKELLKRIKNQPEKLAQCYDLISNLSPYIINGRNGKDKPLSSVQFVLAEDEEYYPPDKVMILEIDLDYTSNFLKATIPEKKKLLHPEIAKNKGAVEQLKRCGLQTMNKQTMMDGLKNIINGITSEQSCPSGWKYPDDLIEATLFVVTQGNINGGVGQLVAQDGTLHASQNLFVPKSPLDWTSLWKSGFLPGFRPVHEKYLARENSEKMLQFFENLNVHGFKSDCDKSLTEKAGEQIAKKRLEEKGHNIEIVSSRDRLGYDLQCQGHCRKVFETKGMMSPHDISLEQSEYRSAQDQKENYVLVCVYNLPIMPDKVGYKEIPNPERICQAVDKAKIQKEKWLTI